MSSAVYYEKRKVAAAVCGASQKKVGRNFNWIWFLGAAVWFVNAALSMHNGVLRRGLADAAIAALFLVVGMVFRRMDRRPPGRNTHR